MFGFASVIVSPIVRQELFLDDSRIYISQSPSDLTSLLGVNQCSKTGLRPDTRTIALKLEIERVGLLYRQNVPGGLALIFYAFSYAFVCGDMMSTKLLAVWLITVSISGACRMFASWRWTKYRERVQNISDLKPWHWFMQSMLFISGAAWGTAGWMMRYAHSPAQQIFASLTVLFMCAGAIVCWSISKRAMLLVVIPAFAPWLLGMFLSHDPIFVLMGVLGAVQLALGTKVGIDLGRYVERALKLTIENTNLNEVLQKEIRVKDQTEQALRLALASSNAMEWSWDVSRDIFACKGDLSRSLGLNTRFFSASLSEFLQLLQPEDRLVFQVQTQELAIHGGELDTELRVPWGDGKLRDLVFRGSTQVSTDGKITSITGIAWDTTAQKAQVRIRQERDIHEAANKAKSMFLANASHEIRTPLAAINGYVEALLQKLEESGTQDAQTRSDLLAIDRNSKHLISLVNDFLDLSKLDTGRLYIQNSPMSLDDELAESILMVKAQLEAKNLKLDVEEEAGLPAYIESDALRFRQILVNLLSNAIKFTENGIISVRISHESKSAHDGVLSIRIADTGIGMDDVTKSHLFEPFMRGTSRDVQRVSGSGLGLALSRHLAKLLGGDLRLISSERGRGSEFELTMRMHPVVGATAAEKDHQQTHPNQLSGLNLLVVDDDDDLRDLMQRFLKRQGAIVEIAENGAVAVELASRKSYDAILMDMKMPVVDGYEATTRLRRSGYTHPIVALTAYANTDDKQRSLEAGCDNYLSKPVDFAFMVTTIRSCMNRINPGRSPDQSL